MLITPSKEAVAYADRQPLESPQERLAVIRAYDMGRQARIEGQSIWYADQLGGAAKQPWLNGWLDQDMIQDRVRRVANARARQFVDSSL